MNKIITAQEFLKEYPTSGYDEGDYHKNEVESFMVEFAKLHVEAALEAASDNAQIITKSRGFAALEVIDKASIQESYPLENII